MGGYISVLYKNYNIPIYKFIMKMNMQIYSPFDGKVCIYRRFNAIVSQLKMHYFSEGAFESLIASQLLKKEKYI